MPRSLEPPKRDPTGAAPAEARRRKQRVRRVVNVGALMRDREFIKVNAYLLPKQAKRRVLAMMARLRRKRTEVPGGVRAAHHASASVPEMTSAELVREINWRVGTLPPDDAAILVGYIGRLSHWRTVRRRRAATPPASSLLPRR